MRKLILLVAVALFAVLGTAGIVSAVTDHSLPPDDVFTDVNPCTGALTTITVSFKQAVFHESQDATGGLHLTGTAVGTITTADGFSGRQTFWFGANIESGGSDLSVNTFTESATLRGPGGQVVVVHGVAHISGKGLVFDDDGNLISGTPTVAFEKFSLECKGKPN